MQLNPFTTPEESDPPSRPRRALGWSLFGSIAGLIGIGILSAEALCLLWMGIDREFRGLIFGAGDAIPGLASYMVIGLLYLASARFALLGQRRLALAFFFLPIALFIIVLQLGSK